MCYMDALSYMDTLTYTNVNSSFCFAMASGTSDIPYNVPIKVLSTKTTNLICEELNTFMILSAENGLLRDWRGLSELLHIEISVLEKHANPTQKLLQLAQNDEQKNTIEVLLSYLQVLDRFDIIDDYKELIDNDIKQYILIENAIQTRSPQVLHEGRYDAMILYAEADADFAYNLVDVMEKNYHMKLFVQERNLKAGDKEVQKTLSVIAEQSNKLIVVLSPDFLTSPMNEFFLDYAQTTAIEQRSRKIIPCMFTPCPLPHQLLGLHILSYTGHNRWGSFWDRLADSIKDEILYPRILEPGTSAEISSALCPENKLQLCPTVSNNNSLCNLLIPSNIAHRSTPNLSGFGSLRNSNTELCSDGDSECKKKSNTKKVSIFLSNVTTKLLPKKAKKKSKSQKEKLAVAL